MAKKKATSSAKERVRRDTTGSGRFRKCVECVFLLKENESLKIGSGGSYRRKAPVDSDSNSDDDDDDSAEQAEGQDTE